MHARNRDFWVFLGFLPVWGLLRLSVYLPHTFRRTLGRLLGRLLLLHNGKGIQIARTNIKLCFPQLTPAERADLLAANSNAMAMSILEAPLAWWGSDQILKPLGHIHGLQYIKSAEAAGRGILMCSAHCTSLEIAGRLFSMQHPVSAMYRPQKNHFLDQYLYRARKPLYQTLFARNDLKGMIKALKAGSVVWYTPDVDAGHKNSVFAPFFGIEAATLTVTARLAKITNAVVIPAYFYRRDDGSGYDLVLLPALENYPSGDAVADATTINALTEKAILKAPAQYLWAYKRFKTRPNNESRFYRSS